MPTERLSMRRIRDLLRLKYENGLSSRQIAAALGMSKGAVGGYLKRAMDAGLVWPPPDELTDAALERRLFPSVLAEAEAARPKPNWAYIDAELRRPNMTRALLWEEYKGDQPATAYGYTWFCVAFDAWKQKLSPSMRQHHVAGEKVFVDYAGSTIDVINPKTGEAQAMKLFVAAMGASSFIFATARPSEGLADWIACHVDLLAGLCQPKLQRALTGPR